jgi:hypothetical protein
MSSPIRPGRSFVIGGARSRLADLTAALADQVILVAAGRPVRLK